MEIVYGTKNQGKILSMKQCLNDLVIKPNIKLSIIGLDECLQEFGEVEEQGKSPLDNARYKAISYFNVLKKPVFSMDSSLRLNGVASNIQPGLNIRRVNGKRLSDDEMIKYYSELANGMGGFITARYINGICLIIDSSSVYEYMGEDIYTEEFLITSVPHKKRVSGFPLDSLSMDKKSKRYFFDIYNENIDKEKAWNTDKGFQKFFVNTISDYLNREQ